MTDANRQEKYRGMFFNSMDTPISKSVPAAQTDSISTSSKGNSSREMTTTKAFRELGIMALKSAKDSIVEDFNTVLHGDKLSSRLASVGRLALDGSLLIPVLGVRFGGRALAGDVVGVVAKSATLRQRMLGNIEDSKVARISSNFAVYGAKENQVLAGYNADTWTMTYLNKGDIVYGGLPGQSSYYTSEKTLLASGHARESLFQSLQVKPDPDLGYRPAVGV